MKVERLLIVLGVVGGLFLLWLAGYIMAINGYYINPAADWVSNGVWAFDNAWWLFMALAIIVAVSGGVAALIMWIRG